MMVLICFGWALPWGSALWAVLCFYALVQLNWCMFGNRCLLTILEERLRGTGAATAGATEEPLHFVQVVGARLLRRPVSRFWADVFSYAVVWGGFGLTAARLFLRG